MQRVSSRCVSVPTFHRTRESQLVWRITVFTMRNTITEDKLTNKFEVGDKMTRDAPTARTGLALCHRVILDSLAHWWVPGKDTHGTPVPLRRAWVAHNKLHATPARRQVQGYSATPWLPTW